jgi:hypothetical protein
VVTPQFYLSTGEADAVVMATSIPGCLNATNIKGPLRLSFAVVSAFLVPWCVDIKTREIASPGRIETENSKTVSAFLLFKALSPSQ